MEFDDLLDKAKELGLSKTKEEETKVEETKVETKVEKVETETGVETQVETQEVDENNSFLEVLKDANGKKEEVKPEVPAEFLAELETYKTKLAAIESDPLVKAVMAEATKEQLVAIAAELKSKDYSKSSYKDLMEVEIRNEGYEGDELEQQLEAVLEVYESMLPFEKKRAEKSLQEKFQKEAVKGESPTLSALEAAFQEKLGSQPKAEDIQKIVEVEKKEINTIGSKLLGKKLYGVEFTADTLKDIVEKDYDVNKVADFIDKEGNLDAVSFIQSKFIAKNFGKMIDWAKEEGAREANKGTSVTKGQGGRTSPVTANAASASKQNKEGLLPDYVLRQMPD